MKHSKLVVWCGIGALSAMVALGGCGSTVGSEEAIAPAPDESANTAGLDGPVMRHLEAIANEGEDAEILGLVEIEGDCLYVALDEVGERFPIVWPASTAWDPDSARVLLPNGESVGHGDSVYGGGGYRYVDDVEAVAGGPAADLAVACVDNQYGEIAVVNNQPDGIRAGGRTADGEESNVDSVELLTLDGDWLVQELIVDGVPAGLDPTWPVTVTIEGETISGTSACNRYGGVIDWSTEAGYGRFVVSELRSTKKGCEARAMEIEQSFLAALRAVDSYEAADGLYVGETGVGTGFHLVRASPLD